MRLYKVPDAMTIPVPWRSNRVVCLAILVLVVSSLDSRLRELVTMVDPAFQQTSFVRTTTRLPALCLALPATSQSASSSRANVGGVSLPGRRDQQRLRPLRLHVKRLLVALIRASGDTEYRRSMQGAGGLEQRRVAVRPLPATEDRRGPANLKIKHPLSPHRVHLPQVPVYLPQPLSGGCDVQGIPVALLVTSPGL